MAGEFRGASRALTPTVGGGNVAALGNQADRQLNTGIDRISNAFQIGAANAEAKANIATDDAASEYLSSQQEIGNDFRALLDEAGTRPDVAKIDQGRIVFKTDDELRKGLTGTPAEIEEQLLGIKEGQTDLTSRYGQLRGVLDKEETMQRNLEEIYGQNDFLDRAGRVSRAKQGIASITNNRATNQDELELKKQLIGLDSQKAIAQNARRLEEDQRDFDTNFAAKITSDKEFSGKSAAQQWQAFANGREFETEDASGAINHVQGTVRDLIKNDDKYKNLAIPDGLYNRVFNSLLVDENSLPFGIGADFELDYYTEPAQNEIIETLVRRELDDEIAHRSAERSLDQRKRSTINSNFSAKEVAIQRQSQANKEATARANNAFRRAGQ